MFSLNKPCVTSNHCISTLFLNESISQEFSVKYRLYLQIQKYFNCYIFFMFVKTIFDIHAIHFSGILLPSCVNRKYNSNVTRCVLYLTILHYKVFLHVMTGIRYFYFTKMTHCCNSANFALHLVSATTVSMTTLLVRQKCYFNTYIFGKTQTAIKNALTLNNNLSCLLLILRENRMVDRCLRKDSSSCDLSHTFIYMTFYSIQQYFIQKKVYVNSVKYPFCILESQEC